MVQIQEYCNWKTCAAFWCTDRKRGGKCNRDDEGYPVTTSVQTHNSQVQPKGVTLSSCGEDSKKE